MRYSYSDKAPKVEAVCSADASRPALAAAWYDADAGELQATNSYVAVRLPVESDEGDVSGFIPPEALKASRKRDAGGLHTNGTVEVMPAYWSGDAPAEPLVTFPREDRGQFPNLRGLWPDTAPTFTVGINAAYLKAVADALGAADSVVVLEFQASPLRPIVVKPQRGFTAREVPAGELASPEALVMPVRV